MGRPREVELDETKLWLAVAGIVVVMKTEKQTNIGYLKYDAGPTGALLSLLKTTKAHLAFHLPSLSISLLFLFRGLWGKAEAGTSPESSR